MKDLERLLDDIFDQALVYHGFTDYMRDYEMVVYCTADPRTGIRPQHLRYLFKTVCTPPSRPLFLTMSGHDRSTNV